MINLASHLRRAIIRAIILVLMKMPQSLRHQLVHIPVPAVNLASWHWTPQRSRRTRWHQFRSFAISIPESPGRTGTLDRRKVPCVLADILLPLPETSFIIDHSNTKQTSFFILYFFSIFLSFQFYHIFLLISIKRFLRIWHQRRESRKNSVFRKFDQIDFWKKWKRR